jgi:hypothetical protein
MTSPGPSPEAAAPTNAPNGAQPKHGTTRRIAGAAVLAAVVFGLLWYTVFSAVTAALVASGGTVVLLAGASASDTLETVFETISNVLLAILAAIAAVFAAIVSFFDW